MTFRPQFLDGSRIHSSDRMTARTERLEGVSPQLVDQHFAENTPRGIARA